MAIKLLSSKFERRWFYNPTSSYYKRGIRVERILLWGRCNYSCPYCKRSGAFRAPDGSVIGSVEVPMTEIEHFLAGIDPSKEMLRLSGGEPVLMPPKVAEAILDEADRLGLVKSIATNMSTLPKWFDRVDYVAGDFKGVPRYWKEVTGIPVTFLDRTIRNWGDLLATGKEVEMRVPIFPFTEYGDLEWILSQVKEGIHSNFILVLRNYSAVPWLDWETVQPETVIGYAKGIANDFGINVLARLRWRVRTIWVKPSGEVEFLPDGNR